MHRNAACFDERFYRHRGQFSRLELYAHRNRVDRFDKNYAGMIRAVGTLTIIAAAVFSIYYSFVPTAESEIDDL